MAKRSRTPGSRNLQTDKELPLRGGKHPVRGSEHTFISDPMPTRVDPCLALLASRPPEGENWAYEVKWDGYRLFVYKDDERVRLLTRRGHDWTSKFPAIAAAASRLPVKSAILDGEAVVLDEMGRSDFSALAAVARRKRSVDSDPVVHVAFDLLYVDGQDVSRTDQRSRRRLLEEILTRGDEGAIQLSEEIDADGASVFGAAREHGLEGIVAKRRDAPYRGGRNGDWQKIKCVQRECFLIIGYRPSSSGFGGIGALLLAARSGDGLKYVGSVASGLNGRSAAMLRERLDKIRTAKPGLPTSRKHVVFVEPDIGAVIEFRDWTATGRLRHVVYKGSVEEPGDEVFDFDSQQ